MDEITEYEELLRDWEYTFWFMAAFVIGVALVLGLTLISPVYYQYNAVMTQIIFLGVAYAILCLVHKRCQELRNHIYTLEHGED